MKKIRKPIKNYSLIRLVSIIETIYLLIFALLFRKIHAYSMALFIACCIIGLVGGAIVIIINRKTKGDMIFSPEGISINLGEREVNIPWVKVNHIYYRPATAVFPGLSHCTLDLSLYVGTASFPCSFDEGQVALKRSEYRKIISFIPPYVLRDNKFMIYRNNREIAKNKYKV